MAFIVPTLSACASPSASSTSSSSMCAVKQLLYRTLSASSAALLISVNAITQTPALAQDMPLVFDHDQSLAGANFENRKDLRGAIFSKANCKNSSFVGSDLTNAQLDDANFQEANLEGVTAVFVMATNTKFQRANLKDVDFSSSNFVSAQFDGANIEGADFTDSLLDRSTLVKLCKIASGVNSRTGVSTFESLMCPE